MPTESRTDRVTDAVEDSVKAAIEGAQRIARESLEAGTEIARRVQGSLKDALEALTDGDREKGSGPTRH
jgi:hypothetical protein